MSVGASGREPPGPGERRCRSCLFPTAPACSQLTRRDLLRAAAALGLSLVGVPPLLTACTPDPREEPPEDPARVLGPVEKKLAIYNWSDYVAPDTIPMFEREFGLEVTYDVYESAEEMVAKLQAGAHGYDIVVPPGNMVPVLAALGLTDTLARRYLTNWSNLSPLFLDPVFDRGNRYTVPYQWGVTGIAWRRDRLDAPPDSWALFQDARWRGKLTMLDDVRDAIGAWLRYRGHSLNSSQPAHLAQARADAIAAKPNLKAYISAPVKAQLVAGDVWAAQLWNGDAAQAALEQPAISFVVPREGSTIWTDSLVLTQDAPHPRAAHEFMNYVLRPDVGAAISATTGYGTPNQKAFARLEHPVPYPSGPELARLEYQRDLGRDTATWDQVWTEVKSA
jgi:spermidine/putrescine transport system substrate-binding protein